MATILKHKIFYQANRFHAAFPSILRFSDNHLLLAFRRARDGMWLLSEEKRKEINPFNRMDHIDSRSQIMLMELDDTGTPVGELDMLPIDPEAGDQDPSLLVLPGDQVFLASFSWYPLPGHTAAVLRGKTCPGDEQAGCRFLFWGGHTSLRSRKGSWIAQHRYISPSGGYGGKLDPTGIKRLVGPTRGQALWKNDRIWLPLYGGPKEGCALFCSHDFGETWSNHGIIAIDPSSRVTFQEPSLCDDGHGGMVSFMRTAGAEGRLATCRSSDGIRWSIPRLHDLIGHPFHPLPLKDGRVLLTYGYREKPYGVRARVLEKPTDNPEESVELILRDDGLSPDIGYPWAVQLVDGTILVVYYLTEEQGVRHIAGTWLEM